MDKLKDVSEIKHRFIDWVKTESAKGFNTPEEVQIMGEVVDMIKDLAKSEKDCMEAYYYDTVTEAMEEGEERMGYDRWRYASGRFAPKGRGTRRGYTPTTYDDGRMMDDRSMRVPMNARMGYHGTAEDTVKEMGEIWAGADTGTRTKLRAMVEDLLYQMKQDE